MELIERRIHIQMSGDLVAQTAKNGLEGDVSRYRTQNPQRQYAYGSNRFCRAIEAQVGRPPDPAESPPAQIPAT